MEMRAIEDTSISEDLTPPLPPLASALHSSSLTSHCSACFSPLPDHPFDVSSPVLYCSSSCSSLDSPLRFCSGELHILSLTTWHSNSSDLRLALRLLHVLQKSNGDSHFERNGRIGGLMTNWESLMSRECENEEVGAFLERIRDGAKAMADARRVCIGENVSLELLEKVLCLVMTNAVEVQDSKTGCSVGVAVYGTVFSWINHSCSPNACYRFSLGSGNLEQNRLRVFSAAWGNGVDDGHVVMEGSRNSSFSGQCGYGPRVIVRSIRRLSEGEEVSIAYTDLLQPKEIREAELWLKYRFNCHCKRCSAVPATYVDCALQAISTPNLNSPGLSGDDGYSADEGIEKLIEDFDNGLTDYLSFNNPELCCEKLENLLSNGNSDCQVESETTVSHRKTKLHLFHHISINAYTALASAYKVRASDMLASGTSEHQLHAFNMCKLSAAYSLLLAGVTHHLFMSESSLIASTANFWINAGESLLGLARTLWDVELSSHSSEKHQDCFTANILKPNSFDQLEEVSRQQSSCIASLSTRVWSKLNSGSSFLAQIQNPIDFCWIEHADSVTTPEGLSRDNHCERLRTDLVNLGRHCLGYGSFLSSICYGFPASADVL